MISEDGPIDGSWELTINVTDFDEDKTLRVRGDLHIGGVMIKLTESLEIANDWSDYALWWPDKNRWLLRTRSTLDQYGIQADARLHFTPMHKFIKLQLPDLQQIPLKVNFSRDIFSTVIQIAKELGLRHPEELSLCRKLQPEDLKKNKESKADKENNNRIKKPKLPSSPANGHSHHLTPDHSFEGSFINSPYRSPQTPTGTFLRTPQSPYHYGTLQHNLSLNGGMYNANGTMSPGSMHSLSFDGCTDLSNSPRKHTDEALLMLHKPKNFSEKARINGAWLDSSKSLMEQGFKEDALVLLRYKFYSFYDLNSKYDSVRINQIYAQAKWSLISEELDCTEEEMIMLAALQYQIEEIRLDGTEMELNGTSSSIGEDDIDAALTDLQYSLEGSSIISHGDITDIPELKDYLRFSKPKKFPFKSYKRYFFKFKDTNIEIYRCRDESNDAPLMKFGLKGCEVTPDVNIPSEKYNIKLFVPSNDGLSEMWIRADTEDQYAKWMAACRLASRGKTMADSSYSSEVESIRAFLIMQHPGALQDKDLTTDLDPMDYVAPRFMKKYKSPQIRKRIVEAHANVKEMSTLQAKMYYIKAWQALPEYGVNYFIVKFKNCKKEELLGIASNRMIKMDTHSGDSIKTWRYTTMKTWSVNWNIRQVQVAFEEEDVAFTCMTADCKTIHEFIGGYIFLSMRSGDKNQSLNEELFHKLTGGITASI